MAQTPARALTPDGVKTLQKLLRRARGESIERLGQACYTVGVGGKRAVDSTFTSLKEAYIMSSNVKAKAAQVAEQMKAEAAAKAKAIPGKPLAAVTEFIAKASEFAGLTGAIELVIGKFPILLHGEATLTTVEEVEGALASFPQFKRYFSERIIAQATAAMETPEYKELKERIAKARQALEGAKGEARQFVEEAVSPAKLADFATWTEDELKPVGVKTIVGGNSGGGRGKRYNPQSDEYRIEKNGYDLRLYRDGKEWVVEVDGTEAGRSESYTRVTAEVWSEYFDLHSSMSVPREWKMREADAAAGFQVE